MVILVITIAVLLVLWVQWGGIAAGNRSLMFIANALSNHRTGSIESIVYYIILGGNVHLDACFLAPGDKQCDEGRCVIFPPKRGSSEESEAKIFQVLRHRPCHVRSF